ncbi:glycosyltransferase family 2 protein [Coriobacteriaceae bacterium]|nr:glycosyltransferase family 2 protein [Coriobacteriaceae bacterium]
MSSPCVSIVIPVYNVERYLVDCLDSIAGQSFNDFEVLLVDDGSTDDSLAVCRRFECMDARFRVLAQENAGAAVARNRALDEAAGEWIMFVDSDDLLECDCVERLLAAVMASGADIALGGYGAFSSSVSDCTYVVPDVDEIVLMRPSEALSIILYQDGLDSAPWGKLFKRHLFAEVRFPPLRSSEDLATIYKPFLKAQAVALMRDSGYRYRLVAGSLSYSEHETEAWDVMLNASDEIVARFPSLFLPCCCRRFSFAFHVFLITKDLSIRQKLWDEIVATRNDVLADGAARKKARMAAAVSFLGRRIAWAVGNRLTRAR